MAIQNEFGVGIEKVQTIVRKEGEDMKPADTQCKAQEGKGRCKNDITYDVEGDFWSKFCERHNEAHNKARSVGGERVAKATKAAKA